MLRTIINCRIELLQKCRYRDIYFNRVLAPEASHFLLLRQKKVAKEKATRCRLLPALRRFCRGLPEGTSLSLRQSAASLPRPFGLFPTKTPVLGAA